MLHEWRLCTKVVWVTAAATCVRFIAWWPCLLIVVLCHLCIISPNIEQSRYPYYAQNTKCERSHKRPSLVAAKYWMYESYGITTIHVARWKLRPTSVSVFHNEANAKFWRLPVADEDVGIRYSETCEQCELLRSVCPDGWVPFGWMELRDVQTLLCTVSCKSTNVLFVSFAPMRTDLSLPVRVCVQVVYKRTAHAEPYEWSTLNHTPSTIIMSSEQERELLRANVIAKRW